MEEEAQNQAQIAATEEAKRLQAEQVRLELEAQLRLLHEKTDADEELRKWIDIKRLQVGRQAVQAGLDLTDTIDHFETSLQYVLLYHYPTNTSDINLSL